MEDEGRLGAHALFVREFFLSFFLSLRYVLANLYEVHRRFSLGAIVEVHELKGQRELDSCG